MWYRPWKQHILVGLAESGLFQNLAFSEAMWDILILAGFWDLSLNIYLKYNIYSSLPTCSTIPTRLSRRHTNTECLIPGGRTVFSIMAHNFLQDLRDTWKRRWHNHIQNVCVGCRAINGGWFLKASRKNNGLKNISMRKSKKSSNEGTHQEQNDCSCAEEQDARWEICP